jgi:hypothetical protein
VVHGLVDAGDEGIRDQQIINGDGLLVMLDLLALNLGTRRMVLCRGPANSGELLPLLPRIAAGVGLYLCPFDSPLQAYRVVFEQANRGVTVCA